MIQPARSSPLLAMAVIAAAAALHGLAAQAAEEPKPCRTPCLSANVQREPAPQPPVIEKAEAVPRPKPAAKPRPQASAAPPPAPSRRCSDINMRAAVGEPLSDQDMKTLRSEC